MPRMQLIVLLVALGLGCLEALSIVEAENEESAPSSPQDVTAFDYDMANEPRRYNIPFFNRRQQQKSNPTTTTPGPFLSYWQNIMRNVRVPVPSITWNVTNPLANLFDAGNDENLLPTAVTDDYYSGNSEQHHTRKQKRRRHRRPQRKHKRPKDQHDHGHAVDATPAAVEEPSQYELPTQSQEQMLLLQQYPTISNNVDFNSPMYFYDPNTDAYYAVQRVRALGSYVEATPYQPSANTVEKPQLKIQTGRKETAVIRDDVGDNDRDEASASVEDAENHAAAEDIDLDQNPKKQFTTNVVKKENVALEMEKSKTDFFNSESLRNALGTFMRDDLLNRRKQSSKDKKKTNSYKKSRPRKQPNYYFLLGV